MDFHKTKKAEPAVRQGSPFLSDAKLRMEELFEQYLKGVDEFGTVEEYTEGLCKDAWKLCQELCKESWRNGRGQRQPR